jgi:hypothetical protein
MARRNISLPDELDEQARRERLNVSALAQRAVSDELARRQRMAALDAWLDDLDTVHGAPSKNARAKARAWLESSSTVTAGQSKVAKARTSASKSRVTR